MSLRIRIPQVARGSRACATIISVALAAGCQPMVRPAAPTPEPPARLLDAGRLELPTDCVVSAGRIYRMSYTVGTDGRTGSLGAITPPERRPACRRRSSPGLLRFVTHHLRRHNRLPPTGCS